MKIIATCILSIFSLQLLASESILSKQEQLKTSEYLYSICPDTFCGGDVNWIQTDVRCGTKYCSLKLVGKSYDEPFFSVEYFNQAKASKKQGQGYKLLLAEEVTELDYDTDGSRKNVSVTSWCRLDVARSVALLPYEEKVKAVYEAAIRCASRVEKAIYNL